MPECVGHWLPAGQWPGQPGFVPDPGKYLSDRGPGDLVAGAGDEEVRPAGEPGAGLAVARLQDPRDLGSDCHPPPPVSLAPPHTNVLLAQLPLPPLQPAPF